MRPLPLPTWARAYGGVEWGATLVGMTPTPLGNPGMKGPGLSPQLASEIGFDLRQASPSAAGLLAVAAARGAVTTVGAGAVGTMLTERGSHPFGVQRAVQGGGVYIDAENPDEAYIYISAGFRTATGEACTPGDSRTCSLWRIHWRFSDRRALGVEEIRRAHQDDGSCEGWMGYVEAAATDRDRVAYVERCHEPGSVEVASASIIAEDVGGKRVSVYTGPPDPAYPAWGGETLLWNTTHHWASTLWQGDFWPDFASVARLAGPASLNVRDQGFEDAHVIDDGMEGGVRVVAFGGFCDTFDGNGVCEELDCDPAGSGCTAASSRLSGFERIPRTWGFDPAYTEVFGLPTTDGFDNSDNPIEFTECHHPAWRPDGQAVLCTRLYAPEVMDTTETGCDVLGLYSFSYDGTWNSFSHLVDIPTREEFRRIPKAPDGTSLYDIDPGIDLFPPRLDSPDWFAGCKSYVWKFAEWCLSADWVVATVYCTDNQSTVPGTVLRSRVVLIDVSTSPWSEMITTDRYVDLTAFIEQHLGTMLGSYDGVFSTCAAVPVY